MIQTNHLLWKRKGLNRINRRQMWQLQGMIQRDLRLWTVVLTASTQTNLPKLLVVMSRRVHLWRPAGSTESIQTDPQLPVAAELNRTGPLLLAVVGQSRTNPQMLVAIALNQTDPRLLVAAGWTQTNLQKLADSVSTRIIHQTLVDLEKSIQTTHRKQAEPELWLRRIRPKRADWASIQTARPMRADSGSIRTSRQRVALRRWTQTCHQRQARSQTYLQRPAGRSAERPKHFHSGSRLLHLAGRDLPDSLPSGAPPGTCSCSSPSQR